MVRFFIFTLLCICCFCLYGQERDTIHSKELLIDYGISASAVFKGDMLSFIKEQIKYPETAKRDSIEGTVIVSFWVDTTGYTIQHKVKRGIREDLNEEALRVTKLIRFDKPAMQGESPVRVRMTVPVVFKRSSNENNETSTQK